MRFFYLVILTFLAGCGSDEVRTPEPGRNSSCVTFQQEGHIHHKCTTGDGLITETKFKIPEGGVGKDGKDGKDGVDGKDGENALVGQATCDLEWASSKVSTNIFSLIVMEYSSGATALSLFREYRAGELRDSKITTGIFVEEQRELSDSLFKVRYDKENCTATFSLETKDGVEQRPVSCDCGGE